MKKLVMAIFILLSLSTYAQTFYVSDSLKSTDTSDVHTLYRQLESVDKEYDFVTIKITLSNAGDSVYVKTSLSDGASFGLVGLKDQLTYETVGLITGSTASNRGYLVLYSPRTPYIELYTNDVTLGGTIYYKIEAR